jgi:hypothetical protein
MIISHKVTQRGLRPQPKRMEPQITQITQINKKNLCKKNKKLNDIQRGWRPQPIIAAGIRKCRKKNFGMRTRFLKTVIQRIRI